MRSTTVEWLGNRVRLHEIDATGLTLVQWHRPVHGAWRGACVLDADELREVRLVLDRLDVFGPGSPVHLESLFEELLER